MNEEIEPVEITTEVVEEAKTPEVVDSGAPPTELKELPKLLEFFTKIKANPSAYPNQVAMDTIFDIAREDCTSCWNSQLPETAQQHFNLFAMAFTTLQKILLHRHGIATTDPRQVQQASIRTPNKVVLG